MYILLFSSNNKHASYLNIYIKYGCVCVAPDQFVSSDVCAGAGLSGCLARCQGMFPRWRELARTCALGGVVRVSRSLPGYVPTVTRASPDMCSGRGCRGVSLVARVCSHGDESEPGHVLWAGLLGCLDRCQGMFPRWRELARTCDLGFGG